MLTQARSHVWGENCSCVLCLYCGRESGKIAWGRLTPYGASYLFGAEVAKTLTEKEGEVQAPETIIVAPSPCIGCSVARVYRKDRVLIAELGAANRLTGRWFGLQHSYARAVLPPETSKLGLDRGFLVLGEATFAELRRCHVS